jgi:hypothetical protein
VTGRRLWGDASRFGNEVSKKPPPIEPRECVPIPCPKCGAGLLLVTTDEAGLECRDCDWSNPTLLTCLAEEESRER